VTVSVASELVCVAVPRMSKSPSRGEVRRDAGFFNSRTDP
jgi:hypothetical protein